MRYHDFQDRTSEIVSIIIIIIIIIIIVFLLKWNVFSSNKFFLVKLTLSKLN